MAFQTGTRVDPRLGALDFSGFTNAANIQAQSMAQLGATIGGAIAANKEKKKEKALTESAAQMVLSYATANPEAGMQLGIESLEDAKIVVKTLGGAKPTMSLLMELAQDDTPSQISPGQAKASQEIAKAMGYEFDKDTQQFQKEDRKFNFKNILPFGEPFITKETTTMSPQMMQGIKGMEETQDILAAEARNQPGAFKDPLGLLPLLP